MTNLPSDELPETKTEISSHDRASTTILMTFCLKYIFLKGKTLIYDAKLTPETTYFPNIPVKLVKGWRASQVTYLPKPFLKFQNPPKSKSDELPEELL